MANGNTNTPKGVGDELKDAFKLPTAAEFAEAYLGISEGSAKINKAFGQTRQRIVEIQTAIADTSPGIARLGGNVNDVTNTISELAQASRRNVIANTEDVDKMFAAQKILGGSIKDIADDFMDVGIGISQIPKELEKAITYVQSIGGNTFNGTASFTNSGSGELILGVSNPDNFNDVVVYIHNINFDGFLIINSLSNDTNVEITSLIRENNIYSIKEILIYILMMK
jgi:hypothetical protein